MLKRAHDLLSRFCFVRICLLTNDSRLYFDINAVVSPLNVAVNLSNNKTIASSFQTLFIRSSYKERSVWG